MNISISPFFYICSFICMITGYFKYFLILTLLIIIHELGHILTSLFFKWKIDKIIILPFGGLTLFNEKIDKSLKEEFLILIMGPLFQIIFTLIINNPLITKYSYALLYFNLLPIVPLDGSKLINIIFNKLLSFKKSHILTIYISIILIPLFLLSRNLIIYIIVFFLIIEICKEFKNHDIIFNKFLLEKYLYGNNYWKIKKIKNKDIKKMKKNRKNIFVYKGNIIYEKEIINDYFKKR